MGRLQLMDLGINRGELGDCVRFSAMSQSAGRSSFPEIHGLSQRQWYVAYCTTPSDEREEARE
jgi:hypothetical protein